MSKRDEYVDKLKAQLDEWNAQVETWGTKAKGTQADMHAAYEKQLETFRHQLDQAMEQMRQVQSATGDAWLELVRGADESWAKARAAFEKARSSHIQK